MQQDNAQLYQSETALGSDATTTPATNPSLEEWLVLPRASVAAYVRPYKLSVMMSVDGTQRHFLLNQPANRPFDFEEYALSVSRSLATLFDKLFSLGVETVMTPLLVPEDYDRPDNYPTRVIEQSRQIFGNRVFEELYQRHTVRTRLFGDYDLSDKAVPYRAHIEKLAKRLAEVSARPIQSQTDTPRRDYEEEQVQANGGSNREWQAKLLLSLYTASFTQEIISRTQRLSRLIGGDSTLDQLRQACFPEGPAKLDMVIEAGWLRVGGLVHPVLDRGETDVYSLAFLALDLDEVTLRRILYDRIFLRTARSTNAQGYSSQELAALNDYYQKHQGCLVGLGHLVGPGLWYPDHQHREDSGNNSEPLPISRGQ